MSARKKLTASQAADCSGISYGTLVGACLRGTLRAVKGSSPGHNQPVWLITPEALDKYLKRYRPLGQRYEWTAADVAALRELEATCTVAQLSEYLGRTYTSVQSKLKKLRESGDMDPRPQVNRVPFQCPASGIWLAKTCPFCGHLRDASHYSTKVNKHGKRYPITMCHSCSWKQMRNAKPTDDIKRQRDSVRAVTLQQMTLAEATKYREEYTDKDIKTLLDPTKSNLAVALELGRTYAAVGTQRSRLGFQKPGSPPKEYGRWLIHFPNAMKALQDHFADLGQPMPEELWDWNDDVQAAS